MNPFSIMTYIAACMIANTTAIVNLGASMILTVGAAIWILQKPKLPKVLLCCCALIVAMSALSYLSLRSVVSSFADVRNLGLWTFSGPGLAGFETVRYIITNILGVFTDFGPFLSVILFCSKKVAQGAKLFVFTLLAGFLVSFFLKGQVFVILRALFSGQ